VLYGSTLAAQVYQFQALSVQYLKTNDTLAQLPDVLYQFDREYIEGVEARFKASLRLHLRLGWAGEDRGQGRARVECEVTAMLPHA